MNTTEENQILVDAEMRRREKASKTTIALPLPAKEPLEAALSRLENLKNIAPRAAGAQDDGKLEELLKLAELPKRHRCLVPNEQPEWTAVRDGFAAMLGSGFIGALCGEQGSGKTQLGVELAKACCGKLRTTRFASAMDFFIALKKSYDPTDPDSESGILNRFAKPSLLVLDEMDERAETEWENRLLFHLINKRYNDMKDTFLISRRSKEELSLSLGKSVTSRIYETGGFKTAAWPSFR